MFFQANLRTFEGPGFEDLQVARCRKYSTFSTFGGDESFVQRNMRSIWSLLNDPHSSELAKVNVNLFLRPPEKPKTFYKKGETRKGLHSFFLSIY